jgi:RNA polymerase sigma factor (sigma-70 family)
MHVTTEAAASEQTDLEDFIAFVTELQPVLRQYAHRVCGNWHTADDLVQETLIILHQRWNRITKDGRSAYARTVLAHLWANERRSARSHLESLPGVLPELPHEGEDEEAARLDIRFAIAKLPLRTRHAILLRYWAGVSTEETAQILGIRPGSARSLLSRAFASMRESLGPVSLTAAPGDGRIIICTNGHAPCK